MEVNDLNGVNKKKTKLNKIDENLDLFKHKNKIMTNLIKLDENWEKKYFKLLLITFLELEMLSSSFNYFKILGLRNLFYCGWNHSNNYIVSNGDSHNYTPKNYKKRVLYHQSSKRCNPHLQSFGFFFFYKNLLCQFKRLYFYLQMYSKS